MEMSGSVLARRLVAASDMPAAETETKVYPPHASLEALLTPSGRSRLDRAYLIEMSARCHGNSPM